jgi:hypothetical protein
MVVRAVDGGGLENRWVNSPGGSNPSPSDKLERCPRGRRGQFAKLLYRFGTEGSNPSLSDGERMKEKFIKIRQKTEEIYEFLKRLDWERILRITAYFPFIGWLLPMYLREGSDECQKNAREGFLLSAVSSGAFISLYLLRILVFGSIKIAVFGITLLHIIGVLVYLGLCVWLMFRTYRKGTFQLPFLSERAARLNL